METPVVLEPSTYYWAEVRCISPACVDYHEVSVNPELYSNGDCNPRVQCYPCGGPKEVVSAVKLDPQPEPV